MKERHGNPNIKNGGGEGAKANNIASWLRRNSVKK